MKIAMAPTKKHQRIDFGEVFRHSSRRLVEEYEITRIALAHRGLKGTAREEALEQFLGEHLPSQFRCTTGEIISTTARSRQVDLIVAHATRTPTLYRSGNIQVVPIEAVLATVEVKTKLDEGELSKAIANIQSVKTLNKTAFYGEEDPLYSLNKGTSRSRGVPGFIFAYDSISMNRIVQALERAQKRVPRERWIDGVFVLKKGHIVPSSSRSEYILKADPESTLLSFYLTLWEHLILSRTPPIRLDAYFPNLSPNGGAKGARR